MRSLKPLGLCLCLYLLCGCATGSQALSGARELELIYDDGQPRERPILPSNSNFELLMKNEPNVPKACPRRLRFLVAQPGRLLFHLYDTGPDGRPWHVLYTIDQTYGPEMASSGSDGKWVVENLPELPCPSGPLWVGISLPDGRSEARLWASERDSGHVFQRDAEPQTAIVSAPVHYTPMVHLLLRPE